MSIKQLAISEVMRDIKNGLGDDFDETARYRLVPKTHFDRYADKWEVVAECEPDSASERMMLLMKEKKNADTSV